MIQAISDISNNSTININVNPMKSFAQRASFSGGENDKAQFSNKEKSSSNGKWAYGALALLVAGAACFLFKGKKVENPIASNPVSKPIKDEIVNLVDIEKLTEKAKRLVERLESKIPSVKNGEVPIETSLKGGWKRSEVIDGSEIVSLFSDSSGKLRKEIVYENGKLSSYQVFDDFGKSTYKVTNKDNKVSFRIAKYNTDGSIKTVVRPDSVTYYNYRPMADKTSEEVQETLLINGKKKQSLLIKKNEDGHITESVDTKFIERKKLITRYKDNQLNEDFIEVYSLKSDNAEELFQTRKFLYGEDGKCSGVEIKSKYNDEPTIYPYDRYRTEFGAAD